MKLLNTLCFIGHCMSQAACFMSCQIRWTTETIQTNSSLCKTLSWNWDPKAEIHLTYLRCLAINIMTSETAVLNSQVEWFSWPISVICPTWNDIITRSVICLSTEFEGSLRWLLQWIILTLSDFSPARLLNSALPLASFSKTYFTKSYIIYFSLLYVISHIYVHLFLHWAVISPRANLFSRKAACLCLLF